MNFNLIYLDKHPSMQTKIILYLTLPLLLLLTTFSHSSLAKIEINNALSAIPYSTEKDLRGLYLSLENHIPPKKQEASLQEMNEIFQFIARHKVTNLNDATVAKYDPTLQIGYCYGRALAIYLEARLRGIAPNSIRKVFIVGDLQQKEARKTEWYFHVTTVIKGPKGQWYAIDPIMESFQIKTAIPIQEWVEIVRETWDTWQPDQKDWYSAKLYWTEPNVIIPDLRFNPIVGPGEAAKKLIQVGFSPGHHGFKLIKVNTVLFWNGRTANRNLEDSFFIGIHNTNPDQQFRFLAIKVPGLEELSYNGYFREFLMDVLDMTNNKRRRESFVSFILSPSTLKQKRNIEDKKGNLFSPNFWGKRNPSLKTTLPEQESKNVVHPFF